MTHFDFQAPAELYLGSDWHAAAEQGSRTFPSAAKALRFALEEAAPVSLKGASLQVGDKRHTNDEMIWLYPFPRKKLHKPNLARLRVATVKETT